MTCQDCNKEISKTQLVPKDAVSLIKSTKEISIKDISSIEHIGFVLQIV